MFEMLQVNDCQASERQEREELTAWQLHCKHIASFFSSSPRLWPTASQPLAVVTQASQTSANSILCGGISGSYQDNILVFGGGHIGHHLFKISSQTCSLLLLFAAQLKPEK